MPEQVESPEDPRVADYVGLTDGARRMRHEAGAGFFIAEGEKVIARTAEQVREHEPSILEPPAVWGVQSMSPNGITIRLVVKTTPSQQWRVTRMMREALIVAFEKENIEMPVAEFPTGVDMPAT